MCKVLNARQVGKRSAGSARLRRASEQVGQPVRHRARRYARGGGREVPRMDRAAAGADGGAARAARQGSRVLVRAGALSCGGADRAGERQAVSERGRMASLATPLFPRDHIPRRLFFSGSS